MGFNTCKIKRSKGKTRVIAGVLTTVAALCLVLAVGCGDDNEVDGIKGGGSWNDDDGRENVILQLGSFTDERDGQTYPTTKIGYQTWMAKNLNYDAAGSACYNWNSANCDTYGRLYDWATVMAGASSSSSNPSGVRGICPEGWHVPSDAEWASMINLVGVSAGAKLKSRSGWDNRGNGDDLVGFTALPGGHRTSMFNYVGRYGYWWTTTQLDADDAWGRSMTSSSRDVERNFYRKRLMMHSLRCVMDVHP